MKRSEAMDEVLNQWRGQRWGEFWRRQIDDVETTLLGRPEKIEAFVAANTEQCLANNMGGKRGRRAQDELDRRRVQPPWITRCSITSTSVRAGSAL